MNPKLCEWCGQEIEDKLKHYSKFKPVEDEFLFQRFEGIGLVGLQKHQEESLSDKTESVYEKYGDYEVVRISYLKSSIRKLKEDVLTSEIIRDKGRFLFSINKIFGSKLSGDDENE